MAGDFSTLPSTAVGGSVTLAVMAGRLRVEVDGRRWAAQSGTVASSDAGARFTMTSAGARAAFVAVRTRGFDLAPSVGADVHFVTGTGFGADANYEASGAWTAVAGGLLGRAFVTEWLALRVRAETFVPLSRPTFLVENEGAVHRPPTLGVAGSFGAEVLFL